MGLVSALLLAVGLAMDAAAVCAARGLVARRITPEGRRRVALYFGGAQAVMPLLGWVLARRVGSFAADALPIVGGVLLVYLGFKMGRESFRELRKGVEEFAGRGVDPLEPSVLLPLAFATSIDALAAGLVLDHFTFPAVLVAALIGLVTAGLSVAALQSARAIGERIGPASHLVGATILIALGARLVAFR